MDSLPMDLHPLIMQRRSLRAIDPTRQVPAETHNRGAL